MDALNLEKGNDKVSHYNHMVQMKSGIWNFMKTNHKKVPAATLNQGRESIYLKGEHKKF